jgi:hypothetical protein
MGKGKYRKYRIITWDRSYNLEAVCKELEKYEENGKWEAISHSHSSYGMSVLMRRKGGLNNGEG